jgi:hypothetical protein
MLRVLLEDTTITTTAMQSHINEADIMQKIGSQIFPN